MNHSHSGHFPIPAGHAYGAQLARVVSVEDPQKLARVQVQLLGPDGDAEGPVWARVAVPVAGPDRGAFLIPDVDDEVLVMFVAGDPRSPVVVGGLWNGNQKPPEEIGGDKIDRWSFTGTNGTRIAIVEQSSGTEQIVLETPNGVTATLTDQGGGKIELKEAGNTVTMDFERHHHQRHRQSDGEGDRGGCLGHVHEGRCHPRQVLGHGAVSDTDHRQRRLQILHAGGGEHMVAARALTLVERRRLPPAPAPAHEVELRPLVPSTRADGNETGMIVGAAEQDFLAAIFADLQSPAWRERLGLRVADRRGGDGVAELYQPISRRFYLVLLEAVCVQPGSPRLDPQKIAGQGLVLRRIAEPGELGGPWQGWMTDGPSRRGWLSVAADTDPDPAVRRSLPTTGHAAIDALIKANRGGPQFAEDIVPLFVAPPAVGDALGKTVLVGLVPLTSSELSEAGPGATDFAAEADQDGGALRRHLSGYLKARPLLAMPNAGLALDKSWADPAASALTDASAADADNSARGRMKAFEVFLQQLAMELGAFEEKPAAQALMALLGGIRLPLAKGPDGRVTDSTTAAEFLPRAADILLHREDNPQALKMPLEWPAVDAATESG